MKATVHADGPQGVSVWMFNVSGTSYPIQMYVAQTWSPEIAKEQTIREVFLKPFELAVKEGRTTAIMTSFNRGAPSRPAPTKRWSPICCARNGASGA